MHRPLFRFLSLVPLLILFAACGGEGAQQNQGSGASAGGPSAEGGSLAVAEQPELRMARSAVNKLGIALKKELSAAMKEGGPEAGLQVCNTQANVVTERIREESGLEVARVSARWRNPDNAPDEIESEVLEAFESDPAHADTLLQLDDGAYLYMKPIRVGSPLCLKCHGEASALAEGVPAKLAELYPEDRATGFAQGDLRGAFTVRFPVGEH